MEQKQRVEWVDYAKGLCIFFVVMLHCTKVVEHKAEVQGWLHAVVDFAKPFRMPDFFMISGLFLARTINRAWRTYFDKKVIHFVYFYVMWIAIEGLWFSLRWKGGFHLEAGWVSKTAYTLIQPVYSPLWFIYVLPAFYLLTRLTKRVPWPIVWVVFAALQIAGPKTGIVVVDSTTERFVYFYSGYVFAPHIFRLAAWIMAHRSLSFAGLVVWGVLNGYLVKLGVADDRGVSLALGCAGALAVITASALLSMHHVMRPLRDWGQRSIVVYLAFFIPMDITQKILLKLKLISDVGTLSVIVTLVAVLAPLLVHRLIRNTPLRFFFERPVWFTVDPQPPPPETPVQTDPAPQTAQAPEAQAPPATDPDTT